MAAYSKAEKLKAKRGRGRPKKNVDRREPNGRAARTKDPRITALEARMRIFGLTREQAMDQKAATNLGRLAMLGRGDGISADQYEAALRYLDVRNDYNKSLLSPGAYYEANGSVDSSDPEQYAAWCERVKLAYDGAHKAIQEAQNQHRNENLWAALQYVIIKDKTMPHMLGAARLVCNALHRYFILDNKSKSLNK